MHRNIDLVDAAPPPAAPPAQHRTDDGRAGPGPRRRSRRIPILTDIWFGVTLLTLLLVYSAVFSGFPQLRGALELTEMAAFQHWMFGGLATVFFVSMFAVVLTRQRWRLVYSGSVLVHFGLLMLTAGAMLYFGTKVEGDVLLQSPRVLVRFNGGPEPQMIERMLAAEGNTLSTFVPVLNTPLTLNVVATSSSDDQPVTAATVTATVGDVATGPLPLTANSREWTPIGRGLEVLLMTFPSRRYFYDSERAAMYFRNINTGELVIVPVEGLPIFRERYLDEGLTLTDTVGRVVPSQRTAPSLRVGPLTIPTGWLEPWRLPVEVRSSALPFELTITGYVPYIAGARRAGGTEHQPLLEPVIEPVETRAANITARSMSSIRVHLHGVGEYAGWEDRNWVLFSPYGGDDFPDQRPWIVQSPDGRQMWQILYSRVRHPLGAQVALRQLHVDWFPGKRGVEAWRSDVRVAGVEGQTYEAIVETNATQTVGDWTLFQSGAPREEVWMWSILGVGNRNGIITMTLGCVFVLAGCLFAFYVKPVLIRRQLMKGAVA